MTTIPLIETGRPNHAVDCGHVISPAILPDELVHGYVGRIGAVNVFPHNTDTITFLKNRLLTADKLSGKARREQVIAKAAGLTLEQLCQQHSLMPFLRATTNSHSTLVHGSLENANLIEKSSFRLSRAERMSCPECVREDIDSWGYSYWRRRHQLPGVTWCDRHQACLSVGEQSFATCPSPTSNSVAKRYDVAAVEPCIDNPVLMRYVTIASGFLGLRRPLPFHEAASKLYLRAERTGIRVSKKGQRLALSDVALSSVPRAWLTSLFPGIEKKRSSDCFPPIDGFLSKNSSLPQAQVLALALMFDSPNEALSYWQKSPDEDGRPDTDCAFGGRISRSSEKVLRTYVSWKGKQSRKTKQPPHTQKDPRVFDTNFSEQIGR